MNEGRKNISIEQTSYCSVRFVLLVVVLSFACFLLGCQSKPPEKPRDLSYFSSVSDVSISADGKQVLFTGCGHKDYERCTLYRYDRDANKLYRYIYPKEQEIVRKGRYSRTSSKIAIVTLGIGPDGKHLYDNVQIGMMNEDGSGLRILTSGEGIKTLPAFSPDERYIAYFKGKERTPPGRQVAHWYDLYLQEIATGKHKQLSNARFYEVHPLYFMPNGKNIVFGAYGPMMLTHPLKDHPDAKNILEDYRIKHKNNTIHQYPVDSSMAEDLPAPMFPCGVSEFSPCGNPMATGSGDIWFWGGANSECPALYCVFRRTQNGKLEPMLTNLTRGLEKYGKGKNNHLVRRDSDIRADGSEIFTRWIDQETHESFLVAIDTKSGDYQKVFVPATAENIKIH